jgi:threonine aldolase
MKKSFASDNYSGVHPEIMEALIKANEGHEPAYGADPYTQEAGKKFKSIFGKDTEVFFVYNGTGANVTGLHALTFSFHSILCSELAHIQVDESTATETFSGCRMVPIPSADGKLDPSRVESHIHRLGDQHHPQVKVISVSQATEYGTVYEVDEIKAIAAVARKYGFYLHMDGARIANAAVSLKKDFAAFTVQAGVDVLSFGGTKNGLMFGEAVVVFNPSLAANFKFIRKQAMQLHSKSRFIAAQYNALLEDDLWKRSATHSNTMATRLAEGLRSVPVEITQKVQANSVYAILPPDVIGSLQAQSFFYVWNEVKSEVRLMCSFDTTEEDVDLFIENVRKALAGRN